MDTDMAHHDCAAQMCSQVTAWPDPLAARPLRNCRPAKRFTTAAGWSSKDPLPISNPNAMKHWIPA
jgi:hypothetical protein